MQSAQAIRPTALGVPRQGLKLFDESVRWFTQLDPSVLASSLHEWSSAMSIDLRFVLIWAVTLAICGTLILGAIAGVAG